MTDEELVELVYLEAGKKLVQKVDFSDPHAWYSAVNVLNPVQAMVYRVMCLEQQVVNGGFIQYFDNGYGIFANDVAMDLGEIKAHGYLQIVTEVIKTINPDGFVEKSFVDYVANWEYENIAEGNEDQFDQADSAFYEEQNGTSLMTLLADFIRTENYRQ